MLFSPGILTSAFYDPDREIIQFVIEKKRRKRSNARYSQNPVCLYQNVSRELPKDQQGLKDHERDSKNP